MSKLQPKVDVNLWRPLFQQKNTTNKRPTYEQENVVAF